METIHACWNFELIEHEVKKNKSQIIDLPTFFWFYDIKC